mmetsp:Transcript_5626/g.7926  ORF Transcript_5626/g.7926 Transcript_5626/m.7926 type:complete len:225 (-) Transcript_5626:742-1416(-)
MKDDSLQLSSLSVLMSRWSLFSETTTLGTFTHSLPGDDPVGDKSTSWSSLGSRLSGEATISSKLKSCSRFAALFEYRLISRRSSNLSKQEIVLPSQTMSSLRSVEAANILNATLGEDLDNAVNIEMIRLATAGGMVSLPHEPRALAGRLDDTVNDVFSPFLLRDIGKLYLFTLSVKSGAVPRRVKGGKPAPTSSSLSTSLLFSFTLLNIPVMHCLSLFNNAASE